MAGAPRQSRQGPANLSPDVKSMDRKMRQILQTLSAAALPFAASIPGAARQSHLPALPTWQKLDHHVSTAGGSLRSVQGCENLSCRWHNRCQGEGKDWRGHLRRDEIRAGDVARSLIAGALRRHIFAAQTGCCTLLGNCGMC
jgi:hypothetical protein